MHHQFTMIIQNVLSLLVSAVIVYLAGRYLQHALRSALANQEGKSAGALVADSLFVLVFTLAPVFLLAVFGAFSSVAFIAIRVVVLPGVFFLGSWQAAQADRALGEQAESWSVSKDLLYSVGLVLAAVVSLAAIAQI